MWKSCLWPLSRLFTMPFSRQGARVWVRDASCVWKEATLRSDYVRDTLTVELEDSGEVRGRGRADWERRHIDTELSSGVLSLLSIVHNVLNGRLSSRHSFPLHVFSKQLQNCSIVLTFIYAR